MPMPYGKCKENSDEQAVGKKLEAEQVKEHTWPMPIIGPVEQAEYN